MSSVRVKRVDPTSTQRSINAGVAMSFDTILYNVRVGRLISMPSLVVTKTVSHMKRWTYKQWRTQLM